MWGAGYFLRLWDTIIEAEAGILRLEDMDSMVDVRLGPKNT